jgi:MoaA/NifB/PqqE/SkfB family radical SAM enzyme
MNLFPAIKINLTNICNQSCPFCFASTEMKTNQEKYLSLQNFKTICQLSNQAKIRSAHLLGGEPTLHPELKDLLKAAMSTYYSIRIFTNGIFSKEVADLVKLYNKRVGLTFNVSTPGFVFNPQTRTKVADNINLLKETNPVAISLVSSFIGDDYLTILKLIQKHKIFSKVTILLALNLPEAGSHNPYTIEQFPKIGAGVIKCLTWLRKNGYHNKISFTNSGFRPCMFNKQQGAILAKLGIKIAKVCHDDNDWFTVSFDKTLSSYRCYPLSTKDHLVINENSDFQVMQQQFRKIFKIYEKQYVLTYCRSCPFFGFKKNQCSGPCMGFRMNATQNKIHL